MCRSTDADLALLNSGTLRSDTIHPKGQFRMKDLMSILPMCDPVVVLKCSGIYDSMDSIRKPNFCSLSLIYISGQAASLDSNDAARPLTYISLSLHKIWFTKMNPG